MDASIQPARIHRPPMPKPSRINGVSVSLFRQLAISACALLEYVCKGSGSVNEGRTGSTGELGAGGGEFVAQPCKPSANASSIAAQSGFFGGCGILCLLWSGVVGHLGGAGIGLGLGPRAGVPGLQRGDLAAQAPVLHPPRRGGGDGGAQHRSGHMAVNHCIAMHWACLFCWRVQTPAQTLLPGVLQS